MDNNASQQDPQAAQPAASLPIKWYKRKTVAAAAILALLAGAAVLAWQKGWLPPGQNQNAKIVSNFTEQTADLNEIANYGDILKKYNLQLSPGQEKYLNQNKFLLIDAGSTNLAASGNGYDEMLAYFDRLGGNPNMYYRTQADTVLVTPDIVLHAYHKFFDLALKDLEEHQLGGQLAQFVKGMYDNADAQVKQQTGSARDHYQKILAQITVARVLLENQAPAKPDFFATPQEEADYQKLDSRDNFANAKIILAKYSGELPPVLAEAASQELQYIYEAKSVANSPLFNGYNPDIKADYTQYTPRSHYTETSSLRAYFRTMMYFGRNAYYFKSDDGIIDAALANSLFAMPEQDGTRPIDFWNKIMAVTGFFAGQSDDLTYPEVLEWINKILPSGQADIGSGDNSATGRLAANVWQLRLPKVLSDAIVSPQVFTMDKNDLLRSTLGFRIFGQRFTFDAWLFTQLTAGQEKTEVKLPSTPSALFVPAAFGSAEAINYAKQFLKNDAGFSDQEAEAFIGKLDQQAASLAAVPQEQWQSSLGTSWLNLLSTLTKTYGQDYPLYMQSQYFSDKQIQTFLGSYTEMKHDTLLYAKQSYAELGGGAGDDLELPPTVKGFVEPNLQFWDNLKNLVSLNQKMFNDNGLSQSPAMARLNNFQQQVEFLSGIAQKEMQGQAISDDDYEQLRRTSFSYLAVPFEGRAVDDPDLARSALIADVHTDTVKGQVLYEATSKPYLMLAIVGDANSPRLAASIAFNHYEFTGPWGGNRLTDEDWKKTVYENPDQLPAKNFWYQNLSVK